MRKTEKIMSGIIMISAAAVMTGWVFNISSLKSFYPGWAPMPFVSSVCFLLSGVIIYFICLSQDGKQEAAQVVLPICALIITLLILIRLGSNILGIDTGIENIFMGFNFSNQNKAELPPAAAMVNFILTAFAAILTMHDAFAAKPKLSAIGVFLCATGITAVIGHIFHIPFFYYDIPGISREMPPHGAALFILLGAAFILLGKKTDRT